MKKLTITTAAAVIALGLSSLAMADSGRASSSQFHGQFDSLPVAQSNGTAIQADTAQQGSPESAQNPLDVNQSYAPVHHAR
jgi:hypothetical protein